MYRRSVFSVALKEAYEKAGRTPPTNTDRTITPRKTLITASHLVELRNTVRRSE